MRYFYEMYPDAQNHPQVVDDLAVVFRIPWGHNRTIIDKCKNNPEKALFYVHKTLENNWSTNVGVFNRGRYLDLLVNMVEKRRA